MTMLCFLVFSVVGLAMGQLTVNLPHGHDLKVLVDQGFAQLDHDPQDGTVTENEWDYIVLLDDANNDSCVSYTEYTTSHQTMDIVIADKIFHNFDHNGDGCLNIVDMSSEFHLIDHNGDGTVSLHEWDQYYTHLLTKLFGHSAGHGNHG